MKRSFDIIASASGILILSPLFLIIMLFIKLTSKGPILYWSERVGKNNQIFRMPKFRTMCPTTPKMPSATLTTPKMYVTPIGSFLRKTSLDELPQIYSILIGDMSIVGPRPVIRNERQLIRLRKDKKLDRLTPGLTGWAQINGRDRLSIEEKVRFDEEYLKNQSLLFDLFIILLTTKRFLWDNTVSH